jgi:hypothetical protein
MELLFESRLEINALDGKLRPVQQRPEVTAQPVLEPDNAGDGAGCSIYGSVLHDGGLYRMWYQGWPRDWDGKNSAIVCYAESEDGVTWRKPELHLDDHFEAPNNVTNLGMHAPSVFIDPEAPPSHRYRAAGAAGANWTGAHPAVTKAAYYTAHSADGLHWTLDEPSPTWPGSDVITSVYHPGQQRGKVALKRNVRAGGIPRRAIWNADLVDGRWQPAACALVPDTFDDTCALARGFASGDYYGMGMQPAGTGTTGFIWQFRHALPRTLKNASAGDGPGVFGVVDVSLAYQPDEHSAWIHSHSRQDFINNADIPWLPHGCIYTAAAPTAFGDEHRLYLCATAAHGWYIDTNWSVNDEAKAKLIQRGIARIGYAAWPAYRLFGYRAEPEGTITLNLGRITEPMTLHLNYETHNPDGRVTAAVRNAEQKTHEQCRTLADSGIDDAVAWQDGTVIQPDPQGGIVLDVALHEATLWAWELRPA